MGRRARRKGLGAHEEAPGAPYISEEHGTLILRGALSPKSRREYAKVRDPSTARAAATTEDVWARASEFLFERLAVSWTVQDVLWEGPADLLARYRVATPDERRWLRDQIRLHLAEHFPEMQAP
ncbi:MAG TPA: hypothetical protein VNT22_10575 [Baekduia sp.]|nr:hypothetical protein [Baekduia sp.]